MCLLTNVHLQSVTVPGKKLMDTSVDHLFKNGEDVFTAGAVTQQQAEADTPTATPTAATAPSLPDTQKTRLVTEYHRQVRTCPTNIFTNICSQIFSPAEDCPAASPGLGTGGGWPRDLGPRHQRHRHPGRSRHRRETQVYQGHRMPTTEKFLKILKNIFFD